MSTFNWRTKKSGNENKLRELNRGHKTCTISGYGLEGWSCAENRSLLASVCGAVAQKWLRLLLSKVLEPEAWPNGQ